MTTESREITIITPSETITAQLNDPLFFDLFVPIRELKDDANELVLTGATGEIFDEEWKYVKRLIQWMEDYRTHYNDEKYLTSEMKIHLGQEYDEDDGMLTPGISLNDIGRIRYILNLPSNWETCVYAIGSSPDVIHHLERMGSELYDIGADELNLDGDTWVPLINELRRVMNNIRSERGWEDDEKKTWLISLIAVIRNATLTNTRPHRSAMILDYDIDLVASVALRLGVPKQVTLRAMNQSCWRPDRHVVGYLESVYGYMLLVHGPLSYYYVEALRGLPRDVHPLTLGLKYIITTISGNLESTSMTSAQSPTLATNDLVGVAKWLNETMTLIVPYYQSGKNEQLRVSLDDMKLIAMVMKDYIVGPIGLERMRDSLVAYITKGGLKMNIMERITSFLEAIEEALSIGQLFPQYRLPTSSDISQLRS